VKGSRIGWGGLVDAFVAALLVGGQLQTWLTSAGWPRWQESLFLLAVTVPLFFRRRFPIGAPVAAWAAAVGMSYAIPEATDSSVVLFLALWFALWSAAANNPIRTAFGLLLLGYAASGIAIANVPGNGWTSWAELNALGTLAWVSGAGLRRRTEHAALLEERAMTLERLRDEEARTAVAAERARIARELHDVVAHSVSVMTVQVSGVRRLLKPEQERERAALETVERTGREALAEMRRLLGVLRETEDPAERTPQPGLARLERLLEQVRSSGLAVELSVEGERRPLAPSVDLSAYRIVQEALTNALKHAGDAHAWVNLRYGADLLELEVANDGRSSVRTDGHGHGLHGMRERAEFCGGTLDAGPRAEGGFLVRATLPVESAP
jgi:signal transduction histidine kinase